MDSEEFCKRITLDLFLEDYKKNAKLFICSICQSLIYNPTSDSLGHLFCYDCITYYLEKNLNNCLCPNGQEKLTKNKITQVKNLSNIYSTLKLKCINQNCIWNGEIGDLPNHLENECIEEFIYQQEINEFGQQSSSFEDQSYYQNKYQYQQETHETYQIDALDEKYEKERTSSIQYGADINSIINNYEKEVTSSFQYGTNINTVSHSYEKEGVSSFQYIIRGQNQESQERIGQD